ncbi:GFA family protein [Hoeflea sp.]|uniref:GFA family protein n=1 Tax=Hoeflea sp. TaxID=1940281 RepID=UPI003B029317
MSKSYKGSCLCGAVEYTVVGQIKNVTACHCTQCRKQTGHHYATTSVDDEQLTVTGLQHITWYHASDDAKRGFCKICGSALFWKCHSDPYTAVLAGSLDGETGLKLEKHIYCADKGDYYEITDGLPQHP